MKTSSRPNLHVILIHYPVVSKNGDTIASAVTNLDLHDIARAGRTYGIRSFYIVTPVRDQIELVDKIVSHYKIIRKIGAGGMGEVYLAEDQKLNREVALKFLPPAFSLDDEAKQRFINEAQAASSFDHPNICTIHEINETDDGQLFIAMASRDRLCAITMATFCSSTEPPCNMFICERYSCISVE